ncbi:MAG: fdoG [Deltaproteobacteria bacterium]|nr:fdoG [Deltaproteobacteria bacterium]
MTALGESFGRGVMTNHWVDIKNADVILIMGSNAAENHPIAFKWIMEAKVKRNAAIISIDPRFTRTSSKADIYAPMRSGTDIAFLGGMINYAINNGKINARYLKDCTNALHLVRADFETCRASGHPGLFSGWDGTKYSTASWDYQYDAIYQPNLTSPAIQVAKKAADLNDPNCVFQRLKEQYSIYTPAMVERTCGTPQALFQQICEVYCNTYQDHLSATQLYAMGWTQHTKGSQLIRTASILQLLLGNIGVAGGGINALRGWHNVQGSTDHGILFNLLTGYNASPQNIPKHAKLGVGPLDPIDTYLKDQTPLAVDPDPFNPPASGNWWANRPKYVVSMLKAWWPSVAVDTSYEYLPKRHKDLSHISIFEDMLNGLVKGLFVWGSNPAVAGPNAGREGSALDNLKWMVVCDLFETETAAFWKRPGVNPATISTEVFLLPGAAFFEKKGSLTNSGRLVQWKDQACDPPGDGGDELEILADLGEEIRRLYSGSGLEKDKPIQYLNWPYDPRLSTDLTEGVAKEIHGYVLSTGALVTNFTALKDDGTTACGNWLYSGTWAGGTNQMANRDPRDVGTGGVIHPTGIGIYGMWGYSWPLNRRIVYNRASVYQTGPDEGAPLAPDKWVIKWDGGKYINGGDVVDGYATAKPSAYYPFIMRNDGVGRLMAVKALAEGPFPEHYEPKETPLKSNPLTNGRGPLTDPCVYVYPGTVFAIPGDPNYPIVATTYRLTEHFHGGGLTRNLPWLSQLMPEPFVELSEELALAKGLRNGDKVIVSSARGAITVRACVTRRFKPFQMNGQVVHQVGLPWHWGFAALSPGASANVLTPHIGDANTRIPEYKAFRPG